MQSVHWLYLVKKLSTSLHLIFIFIKSLQKPIYIHAIFTLRFSFTCSLFFLYLYLYLSFPSSHPPPPPAFLLVYLSFLRSVFHVTPLAGVAKGGLMASLSGVFAAVFLQLLSGYTCSTAWTSVAGGHTSSSAIFSSSF